MNSITKAFGRALLAQLHPKMLLLSFVPTLIAVLLWGALLWWGFAGLSSFLEATLNSYLAQHTSANTNSWLAIGLTFLVKHALLALLAGWLLLPLMIITALIFIGVLAMPTITNLVARDFPQLGRKQGGTMLGSVWVSCGSAVQFCLLWIFSLPLCLIPGVTMFLHPLLLGWLSYRVMSYDALSEHASQSELRTIKSQHRPRLMLIGSLGGLLSSIPSIILLNGGAFAFPVLAVVAIWLYVLVFIFIGLWFEYYCLAALAELRRELAIFR